jgi:hypothetical protein
MCLSDTSQTDTQRHTKTHRSRIRDLCAECNMLFACTYETYVQSVICYLHVHTNNICIPYTMHMHVHMPTPVSTLHGGLCTSTHSGWTACRESRVVAPPTTRLRQPGCAFGAVSLSRVSQKHKRDTRHSETCHREARHTERLTDTEPTDACIRILTLLPDTRIRNQQTHT